MSKAAELAALIGGQKALGDKNFIINGDMRIFQRATAATAASAYDTVDRFGFGESTDGAFTSEKSTDSPIGSGNSLKLQVTTADTSLSASQYAYFFQAIEGQNLQSLQYGTSSAKTLTLSFWVKSNKTGTYTINVYKQDSTAYNLPIEYTISSANTWEKKQIKITPTAGSTSFITSAGGAIADDNGIGFQVGFGLAWGSNFHGTNNTWSSNTSHYSTANAVNWMDSTSNNFYLAQVQLEIGEVATAFEHEDIGTTLAKCQRYFTKSYNQGTAVATATAVGAVYKVMDAAMNYGTENVVFPCSMRATPTVGIYSPVTGALGKFDSNTSGGTTDLNLTTVNIGDNGFSGQSNNQAVSQNAYMRWHYTASAEL